MYKIYLLFTLLLSPLSVFAGNVDIVADTPSGTYHQAMRITLTPTDPESKTFYSFKPDGYPMDAFLYTGSILLKHSSPLIYFSIIDPANESKIKQNDYIIEYPSTLRFEAGVLSGSGKLDVTLTNSGFDAVNIGFWQVQSESDAVIIPEGTVIAPWAKYSVRLNYHGTSSIVLRSPDDDEKDIFIPDGVSEKNDMALPRKKSTVVKIVPRKIISTRETLPSTPSAISDSLEKVPAPVKSQDTAATPSPAWGVISEETTPVSTPPAWASQTAQATESASPVHSSVPAVSRNPGTPDFNQTVKASTNESGQKNMNLLYLAALFILSVWVGGVRWVLGKRQK